VRRIRETGEGKIATAGDRGLPRPEVSLQAQESVFFGERDRSTQCIRKNPAEFEVVLEDGDRHVEVDAVLP
jgi:hypothetical protein